MNKEKRIKDLAKELCDKSGCHYKCKEIDECVVMDEAEEVIANFATTTEKQIEELIDAITCVDDNGYAYDSEGFEITGYANSKNIAETLYNAGYRKIVRCKDCNWWHIGGCAFRKDCIDGLPSADDFCSHGEMKGGE